MKHGLFKLHARYASLLVCLQENYHVEDGVATQHLRTALKKMIDEGELEYALNKQVTCRDTSTRTPATAADCTHTLTYRAVFHACCCAVLDLSFDG